MTLTRYGLTGADAAKICDTKSPRLGISPPWTTVTILAATHTQVNKYIRGNLLFHLRPPFLLSFCFCLILRFFDFIKYSGEPLACPKGRGVTTHAPSQALPRQTP